MKLHVLPSGPLGTNGYLVTEPAAGAAVLIDAPGDVWPAVARLLAAERVELSDIWITHGHWDHTQDAARIAAETGARVTAHPADRTLLEHPEVMAVFGGMAAGVPPVPVSRWLAEAGETLSWAGHVVEVRPVPGHCAGSVLFYFPADGRAFVGDAIFRGSVGRTDLPGGDAALLERSIRTQIYPLPEATELYPGHGGATTVGRERRDNPFVHD